jgi:tetratricopeptide (TPR) repeat protein
MPRKPASKSISKEHPPSGGDAPSREYFGWLLAGLTAVVPFYFLTASYDAFDLPKSVLMQSGLAIAYAAWAVFCLDNRRLEIREFRLACALAVLAGLVGLSFAMSPCRQAGWDKFVWDAGTLALLIAGTQAMIRADRYRRLLELHAATAFLFVIVTLLFAFSPEARLSKMTSGMFNTAGHQGFAGLYLAATIPICFALVFAADGQARRIFAGASGVSCAAYLLLSGNRTGILLAFGALTLCAAGLVFSGGRKRLSPVSRVFAVWLVAPVLIVLVLPLQGQKKFVQKRLLNFAEMMGTGLSDWLPQDQAEVGHVSSEAHGVNMVRRRAFMWRAARELTADRPFFGGGSGSFRYLNPEKQARFLAKPGNAAWVDAWTLTRDPHGDYLRLASEWGLLGLLGFFTVIALYFMRVYRAFQAAEPFGRDLLVGVSGSVLVFLGAMIVWFPISLPLSIVVFALCLAAPGACAPVEPLRFGRFEKIGNGTATVLLVSVMLSAGYFIFGRVQRQRAEILVNRGRTLAEAGRFDLAGDALRKAIAISPTTGRASHYLGNIEFARGRYPQALESYGRALTMIPDPNIHYSMGMAYWRQGRMDSARAAFEESIRIMPRMPEAIRMLAQLYAAEGRFEEGQELLSRLKSRSAGP